MVRGKGLGLSQDRREGGRRGGGGKGRKRAQGRKEGFDPLKVISKYINFKGSKGKDLLNRRIFSFFIKPLKGFYKKDKKSSFKERPREEGLGR